MMKKFISADEAANLINDGDTIASLGFGFAASPEEILRAIGQRYQKTGHPKDITVLFSSAQGDSNARGLDHLAQKGLIKRAIGGFFGVTPKINDLVTANAIEAYNFPQGQIAGLYQAIAKKQPGLISRVGLNTFIDPRFEGGKLNDVTKTDLVELIQIKNNEYLLYPTLSLNVILIRGTTADERGNISMEREAVRLETMAAASAARASNGIVIVQVERVTARHTMCPTDVAIPGYMTDVIVVSQHPESNHMQTVKNIYNPAFCGDISLAATAVEPVKFSTRSIIAKRAFMEIHEGSTINLGTGIPETIGAVISERGFSDSIYLTLESGVSGGIPETQPNFGVAVNPEAIIRHDDQFCFYNAGGLDIALLGFAQVDIQGNVNVSKFNGRVVGCGGFIDIAQNAKKIVFCGTLNSGGLKIDRRGEVIKILQEGRHKKFVHSVEQITFNGPYANSLGQKVIFVTERCVFELTAQGLMLTEVASGINITDDILPHLDFKPLISQNLRTMPEECFR